MIDGGIGVFCPAQRFAGVANLSAGLLLQAVTGRRLAAVSTVQAEAAFQFGDTRISHRQCRQQPSVLCLNRDDHRFQTRYAF